MTELVNMDFNDPHRFDLHYDDLQPHQKKFWDIVETLLKMGITPTPRVVNEALGKPIRTSWNGPLCRIRSQLLTQYDYELVEKQGFRGVSRRWKKKKNNEPS